jgi:hypothetical protein
MFSCERSHDRRYMYYCPLSVLSRGIRFSFCFSYACAVRRGFVNGERLSKEGGGLGSD